MLNQSRGMKGRRKGLSEKFLTAGAAAVLAVIGAYPEARAANDYTGLCASCHGPLASSSRSGRSASQIKAAITANRGGMGSLVGLTNVELNAIARELGGSANLPEPEPAPSSPRSPDASASPSPSPSASPSGAPAPSPSGSPEPSPSASPNPSPTPASCASGNTPVVNGIPEQDATVGKTLTFKVSAFDCDDVPILIKASRLKGGALPSQGQDFDDSGLWTGQYAFTPAPGQANKAFVVKFTAIETEDDRKTSAPVAVRIRVFPQGSSFEDGAVTDVKVQSARWAGSQLQVKGKVAFSKALDADDRRELAASSALEVTDAGGGLIYGSTTVSANGKWSLRATLTDTVPCSVAGQFNGKTGTPRIVKKAPANCR